MRSLLCLALINAAAPALADCPVPGQQVTGVVYDDGTVLQDIRIVDDVVETSVQASDGSASKFTAKYGLYYEEVTGDSEMSWTWSTSDLPRPEALPVEQATTFDVEIDLHQGSDPVPMKYKLVSHGPEVLAVGDCEIPVIRVEQMQVLPEGGGSIASLLWLDPERMVILKNDRQKLDASGTVEAARSLTAVELKM
jgi:hypothetical protein